MIETSSRFNLATYTANPQFTPPHIKFIFNAIGAKSVHQLFQCFKAFEKFLCLLAVVAGFFFFAPQIAVGQTTTFDFTGGQQTYVVPAGVTSLQIQCYGAQGGTANGGSPGLGGYSTGILAVTQGETLYIFVGGQGGNTGAAGYNGGGTGFSTRAGGGGASDVRQGGNALANRKIIAGGGGGGGYTATSGGHGGGTTGGNGGGESFGYGATQAAGGNGFVVNSPWNGTLGQGGSTGQYTVSGGGGGYYGGGAGLGAGGGSSYIGGVTSATTTAGQRSGNGRVVIQVLSITGAATLCGAQTTQLSAGYLPNNITGGTISYSGGYKIHTFTTVGNHQLTVPAGANGTVEVLVVAGGGGGSASPWGGGGGGGGGVIHHAAFPVSGSNIDVVVGDGGGQYAPGQDSYFGAMRAFGGGAASTDPNPAVRGGGSGGGAGHMNPAGAASPTTQTSNNGGTGYGNQGVASVYTPNYPCGSGGGAGGAGSAGGAGGAGIGFDISGSLQYYGAGGGQCWHTTSGWTSGGGGGGVNGGTSIHRAGNGGAVANGGSGIANSGGGGGGSRGNGSNITLLGGSGGSGIVIVRYPDPGAWSSSNNSVATVNASTGLVTAGSQSGKVTITYTIPGGVVLNHEMIVDASTVAASIGASAPSVCQGSGDNVTLTASGGTLVTNTVDVWYQGGCNDATETWNSMSNTYTYANMTVNSVNNGILDVTSNHHDPMINMPNLGSFNPAIYRYVNIRYKVKSGAAGNVEIFFFNEHYDYAHGDHHRSAPLISNNQWQTVAVDMYQNSHYLGDNSNITGFRFDWATADNVNMEIDFISLSQFPIIGSGTSITVAPTTTTTYYTKRIGACNTTCISKEIPVVVCCAAPSSVTIGVQSGSNPLCVGSSVTLIANFNDGFVGVGGNWEYNWVLTGANNTFSTGWVASSTYTNVLPADVYNVQVTVRSSACQASTRASTPLSVTATAYPTVNAMNDFTVCYYNGYGSIALNGTNSYSNGNFVWEATGGTIGGSGLNTSNITPATWNQPSVKATLKVTGTGGCSNVTLSDDVNITLTFPVAPTLHNKGEQ